MFQRFPEHAGTPHEVQLMLLGSLLTAGRAGEPAFQRMAGVGGAGRYFPETGHRVSGRFMAYWGSQGGLPSFGYPISEQFEERNPADGQTYLVQSFQRARFEYHPERAGTPNDVQLGLLGVQYAASRGLPESATARERPHPEPVVGALVSLGRPALVVINDSFISPLVELFGDVSVGRYVFIAGNTTVRADPEHRICIGHATNLQDNVLFLALRSGPAPAVITTQAQADGLW